MGVNSMKGTCTLSQGTLRTKEDEAVRCAPALAGVTVLLQVSACSWLFIRDLNPALHVCVCMYMSSSWYY